MILENMRPSPRVRLSASIVDVLDSFIESVRPELIVDRKVEDGCCDLTLNELRDLIETAASCQSPKEPLSKQLLRYLPVTAAGDVGIASMTAATLGEALETGVRFLPLVFTLFDCHQYSSGNKVVVEMRCRHDLGETCNAVLTELQAGLFRNMAFFAQHAPQSSNKTRYRMRLSFSHEPQGDKQAYREIFGEVPDFGQATNCFSLSKQVLRQSLLTANRVTHSALIKTLEERLHRYGVSESVSDRVRNLIRKALVEGELLTSEEMALRLFMSSRTLNRRLEKENTHIRLLMDQARLEYAKRLLQTTSLPISTVANKSGYKNPSSFSRAFKRYFDVSPGQCRS